MLFILGTPSGPPKRVFLGCLKFFLEIFYIFWNFGNEGNSTETCAGKFPLMSVGGWAGVSREQTRERVPPSVWAKFFTLVFRFNCSLLALGVPISAVSSLLWPSLVTDVMHCHKGIFLCSLYEAIKSRSWWTQIGYTIMVVYYDQASMS